MGGKLSVGEEYTHCEVRSSFFIPGTSSDVNSESLQLQF